MPMFTLDKQCSIFAKLLQLFAVHSPLVTQATCGRDFPYEGCLLPSVVVG